MGGVVVVIVTNIMEEALTPVDRQELHIVGHLRSLDYHKAIYVAKLLVERYPEHFTLSQSASEGLMEFQWIQYKEKLKQMTFDDINEREEGMMVLQTMADVVIYSNNHLRWSWPAFLSWTQRHYLPDLEDVLINVDFPDHAHQSYVQYITNDKCEYVYLSLTVDGQPLGTLVLELYKELCPLTVNNFVSLCTGDHGTSEDGTRLWYSMSVLHRIVPHGWIQGGDICGGSGSSGMSIYGPTFADECFAVSHDSRGILGMVNHGLNTNNSQFYITLAPAKWMDRRYVAFGRVIEGTRILENLEMVDTYNDRPTKQCMITDCGVLMVDKD